jgi:hypothetical protein
MTISKLRVKARGTAMVCDLEAMEAGARRFVGRKHDPSLGLAGGWPPHEDAVEVPNSHEYRKHVIEGDLEAADEETAKACGVKFEHVAEVVVVEAHDEHAHVAELPAHSEDH